MAVLRKVQTSTSEHTGVLLFYCPGCQGLHQIHVNNEHVKDKKAWGWNGSMDKPTFTPSYLIPGFPPQGEWKGQPRCHSLIADGNIQYLADCEHSLAGKTVPLPNDPLECFDKEFDENGLVKRV